MTKVKVKPGTRVQATIEGTILHRGIKNPDWVYVQIHYGNHREMIGIPEHLLRYPDDISQVPGVASDTSDGIIEDSKPNT